MTTTASETPAQVTSAEPQNAFTREAEKILDRAQLAIDAIEGGVEDLNGAMVELLLLAKYDLPDEARAEVEFAADNLGAEANELFGALGHHFEELRKELVAAAEEDGEDENEPSLPLIATE